MHGAVGVAEGKGEGRDTIEVKTVHGQLAGVGNRGGERGGRKGESGKEEEAEQDGETGEKEMESS